MISIGILYDDEVPFQAYLKHEYAESAARQNKLQIRRHRRIRPKVSVPFFFDFIQLNIEYSGWVINLLTEKKCQRIRQLGFMKFVSEYAISMLGS